MDNPFAWSDLLARAKLTDPFAPGTSRENARKAMRKMVPFVEVDAPPIAERQDLTVPGADGERPARLYIPHKAGSAITLFFHGGGYAFGDLETHDRVCQRLAAISGHKLLAIDYRLAPEHCFPAGYEDCLAAFDWLVSDGADKLGVDAKQIAVAGDSAGGGLTAAVTQARRQLIKFQFLIYPLLQLAETRKIKPKMLEGHMLSAEVLKWIHTAYCGDTDPMDVRISPLYQEDLAELPPTHIIAAELDPLYDEGVAYRDRLQAAGIRVTYELASGLPHGFFNMTRLVPGAQKKLDEAALVLKAELDA